MSTSPERPHIRLAPDTFGTEPTDVDVVASPPDATTTAPDTPSVDAGRPCVDIARPVFQRIKSSTRDLRRGRRRYGRANAELARRCLLS